MSFLIPGTFLALFIVAAILFFGIRAGRPRSVAPRNPGTASEAESALSRSAAMTTTPVASAG